jgi:methyl-accepting chemotaxis protein
MSTLETLMIVLIAVTALAVVIQMFVLIALYSAVRKSASRMEGLFQFAQRLEARTLPTVEMVQNMLQEYRPKLDTVLNNVAETTTTLKYGVERLDAGAAEISDRVRLQALRIDELVSRALDRVENATTLVQSSVASPVRQATGVLQGLTAGLATFFNKGPYARAKRGAGVPKDDMFV